MSDLVIQEVEQVCADVNQFMSDCTRYCDLSFEFLSGGMVQAADSADASEQAVKIYQLAADLLARSETLSKAISAVSMRANERERQELSRLSRSIMTKAFMIRNTVSAQDNMIDLRNRYSVVSTGNEAAKAALRASLEAQTKKPATPS